MAWMKEPKLVASCGVGYQTFNNIKDSLEQLRNDYLTEHSNGEDPHPPEGLQPTAGRGDLVPAGGVVPVSPVAFGRHNSPLISVGVARVAYDDAAAPTKPNFRYASSQVFGGVTRISTGVYVVAVNLLDSWVGRVTVRQVTHAQSYAVLCYPFSGAATLPNGLLIYISSDAGGTMAVVDSIEFFVNIYSRSAQTFEATAPAVVTAGIDTTGGWRPTLVDFPGRSRPVRNPALEWFFKRNTP
jgi:hypothetical protein